MRIVFGPFGGKAEAPVKRLPLANADNLSESDMHLFERDIELPNLRPIFQLLSIGTNRQPLCH